MEKTKKGFTLAEVLVTLGIIGVVAALTTPTLIQNVGDAKVAPRLQKAKATFETAAEMMLNDQNANSILSVATTPTDLGKALSNYMKISYNGTAYPFECGVNPTASESQQPQQLGVPNNSGNFVRFDSDDGVVLWFYKDLAKQAVDTGNYTNITNNQLIGAVVVDINSEQKPNRTAKDVFPFLLYNDGTLRPYGGTSANRSTLTFSTWQDGNCDSDGVGNPLTCTGSIFEHGMKIVYDYAPTSNRATELQTFDGEPGTATPVTP